MADHYAVLDVGKTHAKISILNDEGDLVYAHRASNTAQQGAAYTALDLDGLWAFFVTQLRQVTQTFAIKAITTATHGAAAVLVNRDTGEPFLPAMDYEYDGFARDAYDALRPDFAETLSPKMPLGLNLGRQLHHQLSWLSDSDRSRLTILLYPNYWAYRLSGVASAEVTSLGCHTDLWSPGSGDYSALVDRLGVRDAFAPLVKASQPLAPVSPQCADLTGLSPDCLVYPGMHDSNAGYFPHLALPRDLRPTIVSTGTWSVAISPHTPLTALRPELDMLANVDAEGTPVSTARYMGGREFARLCEMTSCDVATDCDIGDLEQIVRDRVFALPSFGDGSGPFGQHKGAIVGAPLNGKALATVYSALMLDVLLTNLHTRGSIVIEGSFAANDLLCAALAALRPDQDVHQFRRSGGVVSGCFRSMNPDRHTPLSLGRTTAPLHLAGLDAYAAAWREQVAGKACLR